MDSQTKLWLLVIGAILATYIWRMLGVTFSHRISPDGAIFQWVSCVSYAMLAGLIARMIFIPIGPLTEVTIWPRIIGIAVGLGVFFISGKRVLVGVSAGLAIFIAIVSYTSI